MSMKQYLQTDLNDMAKAIYQNAIEKGFYETPPTLGKRFMMIVSELSEALEADRKGKRAAIETYDAAVFHGMPFETAFTSYIKYSFEEELADTVIRVLHFCAYKQIEIDPVQFEDLDCDFHNEDIGECLLSITGSVYYASVSARTFYESDFGGKKGDYADLECEIYEIILKCFNLAEVLQIDLLKHIVLKMQYNTTCEYKHGKAY